MDCSSFPKPSLREHRGPPVEYCFTGQCRWPRSWMLQRAHLPQCLRVAPVIRAIQSQLRAADRAGRKSYSLSSSLKTADFQSSELPELDHFISAHMCRGPSPSACACISKPTFYSHQRIEMQFFLKTETHAFLNLRSFEDLVGWLDMIFQLFLIFVFLGEKKSSCHATAPFIA